AEDIHQRTKIDPWFLHNIREIVALEDRLRAAATAAGSNLEKFDTALLLEAKQYGFSDMQLATLWHTSQFEIRRFRKTRGVVAAYKLVDTCAAEFEAFTPYYYSTYEAPVVTVGDGKPVGGIPWASEDETRPPAGKDRIMILGGGPNR